MLSEHKDKKDGNTFVAVLTFMKKLQENTEQYSYIQIGFLELINKDNTK